MGDGPMRIPYGQLHFAIGLSNELIMEAPAVAAGPLFHQLVNLLEGPSGPHFDSRAGNPWEGKDPKDVVPAGIIPALQNALNVYKLVEAERAIKFTEHARDIASEAIPQTGVPPDINDIRRSAKVVSFLLQAAFASFP